MGEVAVMDQPRALAPRSDRNLTAVDVRQQVNLIQEVMQAVMKKDVHYGVIPGCKQPSLYKAGSEVLLATFRIAVSVHVDDLSTDDSVRYRVRTVGTHQGSGVVVGEGIGECSSNEEKYKWRRAYQREFDDVPENRRRKKYGKDYTVLQVRTDPADVANTILKMAKKRAQVDMTLTATAASDCFAQDLEDLPEHLREDDVGGEGGGEPPVSQPQRKSAKATPENGNGNGQSETAAASPGQLTMIRKRCEVLSLTEEHVFKEFSLKTLDGISVSTGNEILAWLRKVGEGAQ